jgi:hypothetical protein
MTSKDDFSGGWVRRRTDPPCFDLKAPDGTIIATFPVQAYGSSNVGIAGKRWVRAQARIPDGTGTLFLNEEDGDLAIYDHGDIKEAGRGPRLATYKQSRVDTKSRLEFPDGQVFRWFRWGKSAEGTWTDETLTTKYAVIHDGRNNYTNFPVDVLPPAADLPAPRLSLLLVLGIYNVDVEDITRTVEDTNVAEVMEAAEDIKNVRRWLRKKRGG